MSDQEKKSKLTEDEQQKIQESKKKAQAALKKRASKGGITDYQYHIVIGGFILVCAVALGSAFMGDHRKLNQIPVVEESYILKQNDQEGKEYQLGENQYFNELKLSDAKLLIQNQLSSKPSIYRCATEGDTSILPDSYNFYEVYPDCQRAIMDQGNCSSAYSVAAVSSISDRFCMLTYKSQKTVRPNISAQTVISCDKERNYQCQGGAVTTVFDYAKRQGLVDNDCLAYQKENTAEFACPTSINECQKYFIVDYCLATDVEGIKKEIYKNGPIVAVMTAFRDFMIYKEGVYDPEEGTSKFRSGQAVKIYGWGSDKKKNNEQETINYWLVENSWGTTWGENGRARIKVKIYDNFLDQFALGAMPKVEKEQEPIKEESEIKLEEQHETTDLDDLDEKDEKIEEELK